MEIVLSTDDITTVPADAIVNAAHHALRGGGGVDGAIHRAGGPAILAECVERYPDGVPTGQAGWTTAGNLPARYVIHVVGPNHRAGQQDPELLISCYRNALRIADELGATRLTLPAVSAGIYGWPAQEAADLAVQTLRTTETAVERAQFCLVEPRLFKAFENATAAGD
ncbi:O-acetyl-ADP-ribose deacetylase (regulator of RNase III) [Kribbella amoyensis]|uniref:O-acetyl-ADP-ribose deacetylase (Regulator of RNase III) n=1 Tax=Kribbella amoyensis TaxID=996641 RepID=A0A561BRS2_9ACTN|nr:O-acetyl-ADP-ribose deacetylase [Kribbella amoyensis]TWD81556.1 O-acetyl-ADP-ribose deacetylase (regulator of RNase III) [Kribbella amoyensis]